MKKMLCCFIILASWIFMAGCAPEPQGESVAGQYLKGEHKLHKMTVRDNTNQKASGYFFLVAGNFSASTTKEIMANFYWQTNDGTYVFSSLPIAKIRVKLDEKTITPTIKFRWRPAETDNLEYLINHDYIKYAVVTIKESDWPTQVSLPMNQ